MSYHASCKCLSDKKQFPCFLRTNPSDTYQATAIAALIEVFQWEYVGTVAADDEYGKGAVTQFISESEEKGVCIAFQEYLKKARDVENILNIGNLYLSYKKWHLNVFLFYCQNVLISCLDLA